MTVSTILLMAGSSSKKCWLFPKFLLVAWSLLLTLSCADLAKAEEVSAENKAAARQLAHEGIRLAQNGRCEEALEPLDRAYRLFDAPTILGWIGRCQVEVGRLVEGTETLHQVARQRLAEDADPAYVRAQESARELLVSTRPRIAKLTISVLGPTGPVTEELEVRVDGSVVASALIGAPRPTDPGTHLIEVKASGYTPTRQKITLKEGVERSISIELEPAPRAESQPSITPQESTTPEDLPKRNGTRKAWGWGLVGGGGLFLAGGAVSGALALAGKGRLDCDGKTCPPSEKDQLRSAQTQATLSTVLFAVGGAALVTGMVVLLSGKRAGSEASAHQEWQMGRFQMWPTWGLTSVGLRGEF